MNGAWLHIATNHIPVVGMLFSFLLLAGGLLRKSRDIVGAAFVSLIFVALITLVVFKSGGPAARIVRNLPEIEMSEIHEHAEAGESAVWVVEILGIMGIAGLWFLKKSSKFYRKWAAITFVGAVAACGWLGWVSHLGGLIRHPEIESNFQPPSADSEDQTQK